MAPLWNPLFGTFIFESVAETGAAFSFISEYKQILYKNTEEMQDLLSTL